MRASRVDAAAGALDEECRVLTRHLIGSDPAAYVLDKYREAHRVHAAYADSGPGRFDALLLRLARIRPFTARLADTYSSLFFRTSIVRKKAVLLLAILESSAPSHFAFETPDRGGKPMLLVNGTVRVGTFALTLLLSIVLLSPLHLALGSAPRPNPD